MKVLKFGGTSVGSPQRMREVAEILNTGDSKIAVLSAVSGTTNKLVALADKYFKGESELAKQAIDALKVEYQQFIEELFSTEEYLRKGQDVIDGHMKVLSEFGKDVFTAFEERAILAQGELMSTTLFWLYLNESGVKSHLISALDFMRVDNNHEPDLDYLTENIRSHIEGEGIFITQGYICRNAFGEIDNLKRGGSDYTATLIGAAIKAENVQIWTDIDGMHNNDPRVVENTSPVAEMSYNEAAELAYFGAKILHPSCVWPAQQNEIPILLKNTMDPNAKGTTISVNSCDKGYTAIAAKDGITALKIRSGRMLNAYGFLRSVFEVFERYKTPIDMITTSEVAVSLTIDDETHLENIVVDLERFGSVEIDTDHVIICVVGDFIWESKGAAMQVFDCLSDIPIRMISYGGSKNNVSILVKKEFKEPALKALHSELFNGVEV